MLSTQAKMVSRLFKLMGVNKMLDKKGADFDKLLETYKKKQKKPLKVPYKRMADFDIETKNIKGTTCYVISKKGSNPDKGVLFPLYPMAPEHRLVETLESSLNVYKDILKEYSCNQVRFFGTSSGGGQAMSLCVYIKEKYSDIPQPGKLVLQSPGLQVPPSLKQRNMMEKLKADDVMIPPGFFDNIAPVLATGDEAYLLSPMLYDLTGFPEITVFYGTKEVMIAYLDDFKAACEKYNVKLNVHIGQDMMHCWGAMEFVPEAKAVRQEYFEEIGTSVG